MLYLICTFNIFCRSISLGSFQSFIHSVNVIALLKNKRIIKFYFCYHNITIKNNSKMLLRHLYGQIYYISQSDSNSRLSTTSRLATVVSTTTTNRYYKNLHYPVQNHKRNTQRHKRICVLILKFKLHRFSAQRPT